MVAQNSFFRHFVKRAPEPVLDDPADLGTAFGLEASLDEPDEIGGGEDVGALHRPAPEQAPMDWLSQRRKARR